MQAKEISEDINIKDIKLDSFWTGMAACTEKEWKLFLNLLYLSADVVSSHKNINLPVWSNTPDIN